MNKRRSEQLSKIAASALRPDEAIEFLTIAKVGTPSRKNQAWVLLLTTILTLGMPQVYVVARPYYLVLTSQRLLLFGHRHQLRSRPPGPHESGTGHRVQRAWVGDSRAARMAGSSPAAAPMSSAAARPPAQASGGMTIAQPWACA